MCCLLSIFQSGFMMKINVVVSHTATASEAVSHMWGQSF